FKSTSQLAQCMPFVLILIFFILANTSLFNPIKSCLDIVFSAESDVLIMAETPEFLVITV
ncbi:hypothetical protein KY310_02465, partial [Candidatus Woesearchaeota archaeon]|nr:hypothetical protein [Candidatus Woesearchaeota archaeon]